MVCHFLSHVLGSFFLEGWKRTCIPSSPMKRLSRLPQEYLWLGSSSLSRHYLPSRIFLQGSLGWQSSKVLLSNPTLLIHISFFVVDINPLMIGRNQFHFCFWRQRIDYCPRLAGFRNQPALTHYEI